jgi:hypothetical protein
MSNVMDMLVQAGYEASSIGSDVLPSTLRKGEEPIGFLLEDMSVSLLPNHETERQRLESVISFSVENQGLETVQGEYKLSQYQDVILTAAYDFDAGRPIYDIYYEDKDKNLILRNSSEDRAAASRDFVSRSGLISGEIPTLTRETDRIGKFVEAIQAKGFQLRENREEAQRTFDITDKDGKVVGYIGKNNRVTITSENSGIKHTLSSAYIDTNPDQLMLPSFFEKLKERLKEFGLALKVIFTGKGQHYAIRNEKQQEIATVNEQHQVTYTDLATADQKAKIDALVDEIRRENQERQISQRDEAQEIPDNKMEITHSEVVNETPALTPVEMQHLAEAVLSDAALTNSLVNVILSNPDFLSRLNNDLAEKLQTLNPAISHLNLAEGQMPAKEQQSIPETKQTRQLSPDEVKIGQEFDKYLNYLQTLDGFNSEKQQVVMAEMVARFGTTDPEQFNTYLQEGKFSEESTLSERLVTSQKIADLQNARSAPVQAKEQEKERA